MRRGHRGCAAGKNQRGDHETAGRSQLRQTAEQAAPALRPALRHHQHGAAPLAAEPDSLQQAQQHQQDRRKHTDGVVGRQAADQQRRRAGQQECRDQCRFATEAIAHVPEDDRSDRPGEKPDRESGKRQQRARDWIEVREELSIEDECGSEPIDLEIIPFDGGSDCRGEGRAGQRVPRRRILDNLNRGRVRLDHFRCVRHTRYSP